ncbi:hypothetical protein [Collimonas pratensis]|uniref:Phage tail protein n=1 Tax=Collimonas pratensis TaxID=279113 RepID=A0ABM5Z2V1_9BURK|nr:hypothetical protein [Collimonas pratensis]AMP13391.1 putative phage tail protein [Collimonas pratensis]
MPGLQIIITNAGRAALVNAEHNGTAPLKITEIGITAAVFTAGKETTALPGEIKRLSTISGEVVAPDTLHVTIRDDGADTYAVRGIGYWLSNGVLLGVYSQPEPILQKSTQSMMLLAADVVFSDIKATSLTFGDANFTNPPATTERQGVVELATGDEAVAGTDGTRAVTPAGLTPALAQAIAKHLAAADPHQQYLTQERGNVLYFRKLPAYTSSDTDCDTLLDTGVRDVSVANDRGVIAATRLPMGADGYGTLTTENGGQFVHQVYTEASIRHRTWQRSGYLGATQPFKGSDWKLLWDSVTFDPASKQDKLPFTPVQQGTGIGQKSNVVKIGWVGDVLKVTVDDLDLGAVIFQANLEAALKNYLPLAGGSVTGLLQVSGSTGAIGSLGPGRPCIEVASSGKSDDAYMTFHKPGAYATHLGLDANNDLSVGGYSMGAVSYKLWHAGNFDPAAKQNKLGYTPVQEGTGVGQLPNRVKIGWAAGDGLKATVDVTDQGYFVFANQTLRMRWVGQSGQPPWLLGGSSAGDICVYNPSEFSVKYATDSARSQNAENISNGNSYMRLQWSDPGGQTLYVWGSDGPTTARLSVVGNLSVGNARTWSGFPLRFAENPGVQPYYVLGIEAGHSEFSIYNRTSMSVGSCVSAMFANQLSGAGLQNQSIGSYMLNKNYTSPEVAGAWEPRGYAYDFGSGGDGGVGSRAALWQRVG